MKDLILRKDISDRDKWNLNQIVDGDDNWELLYKDIDASIQPLESFSGKLRDENELLQCLDYESNVSEKLGKLYAYAVMNKHTDESNTKYQAMSDRAEQLAVKLSTATSYIVPEITGMNEKDILAIAAKPQFKAYKYSLEGIARRKKHILTESEEKILSKVGAFSGCFDDIFSMIDNVDIKWDDVDTDEGKVALSHGRYSYLMQHKDRDVRRRAFESMFSAYKNNINTISAVYGGSVKKDVFYAQVRGYASAMEHALDSENVDSIVYENLIKAIDSALDSMHEYVDFRKRALGYDDMHMYDMYVPICEGADIKMKYDGAYCLVKEALAVMGEDYINVLDEAYNSGWIDVYENKGKRSGAYSWGVYGVHPYVLFNYTETTHDVFTIAHEMGHAMHSYYCSKAQPYACHDYEIFVAEIASTVNEVLLIKYLLKTTQDKKLRKYLLSYYLDMFRTTIFRQTMFAEFEVFAHKTVEECQPLTWQVMSDEYHRLNHKYYGDAVVNDELIKYEWARIPHFYNAFYVYKYATGMISAVAIANALFNGEIGALDNYKRFLSAGGSISPLDTLALAGVDLKTMDTFNKAIEEFNRTLAELGSIDE